MAVELTPTFVMQYEREMRTIRETSYMTLLADENYWANKVLKDSQIERKTERVTWLLNTAMIQPIGPSGVGGMEMQDLVTQTMEYPTFKHGAGITVQVDQLEDLDGTGLQQLSTWASDIGVQTAYYPQQLAAQAILNGANTDGSATAYDGLPFFMDNNVNTVPPAGYPNAAGNPSADGNYSNGHFYNPFDPSIGGYYNWLHGAAVAAVAGSHQFYPGALPIDDSVSADVALQNLGKAIAYTLSIKQANGMQPRFLKVAFIMAPPRMAPRIRLLMQSSTIALQAAGGAGSADVRALISGFGLGEPIIAAELGANFSYPAKMPFVNQSTGNVTFLPETVTGNDTTWYLVMQENKNTQLGGLLHVRRKPFAIRYFGEGGQSVLDAMLSRADEIQYQCKGRMSVQVGHPFAIFRIDAS